MQNKINFLMVFVAVLFGVVAGSRADEVAIFDDVVENVTVENNEDFSADAIEDYQVEGSLFQQITDLEQEKVLMQLEKERAQLNLDLDRLAAEKIKLHMEIDTLSGRAEQQQAEFETERARLEAEAKRLEREKEALSAAPQSAPVTGAVVAAATAANSSTQQSYIATEEKKNTDIEKQYKLINVFGAGSQLQATVQDLATGQNKRVSVGKELDGYKVKSISLDEGVVFVKDGETQTLNVVGKSL